MNIKLMKKGLGISLCVALMMGCAKEEIPADETVENNMTQTRAGLCDLEDFTGTIYANLGQELTGMNFGDDGSIDGYFQCEHGTPGIGGGCCTPTTVWLDGWNNTYSYSLVEFESWGADTNLGHLDLLADGVCTVAEQEDFIDRIYAAAASSAPPCGGGVYSPAAYEVEWSVLSGGAVSILVKVTYTSFCFM